MIKKPAAFPIVRNVVSYGRTYEKQIEGGENVRCVRCNDLIILYPGTVYEADDGMPIVECHACGMKAPILNYFDRILDNGDIKRLKKPLRMKRIYKVNGSARLGHQ